MKKNVIITVVILIIIIIICCIGISVNLRKKQEISKKNGEYERYLNSEIYGSDVVTLINKAISSNESNSVQKDDNDYYINNNENSITIDLVMITNEEKQETTVYKMEAISKVGVTEFIKNFNTAKFECTKKEYHKSTGKIAHIEISQKIINY